MNNSARSILYLSVFFLAVDEGGQLRQITQFTTSSFLKHACIVDAAIRVSGRLYTFLHESLHLALQAGEIMFKQLLVILIVWSKVSQVSAQEEWIPLHKDFRSTGTYLQRHHSSDPERSFNNPWRSIGNVNPYTGRNGKYTHSSHSRSSVTPNNYFFYESAGVGVTRPPVLPSIPASGGTRIYSTRLPVMSPSPTSDGTRIYSTRQSDIPSPPTSGGTRIYSTRQLVIPYPNAEATQVFPLNDSGRTTYRPNNWEREKYEDPQGYNFSPEFMVPPSMDYDAQR
jgi:hypothetical protein